MLYKLLNFIIIFLFISIVLLKEIYEEEYIELPKLGKIELYGQSWVYLDLNDYKKGDKIYLEYIFSSITFYYSNIQFIISETNNYKEINKDTKKIINEEVCYQDKVYIVVDHSCHYKYKLTGNYNYLIIITPVFEYYVIHLIEPQYLKHNKKFLGDDKIVWIVILIIFIIIGLIFLIILYIMCRKKLFKKNTIISNNIIN